MVLKGECWRGVIEHFLEGWMPKLVAKIIRVSQIEEGGRASQVMEQGCKKLHDEFVENQVVKCCQNRKSEIGNELET